MGGTVVRAAAAAAAVVVLAACGDTTVVCGACPGPLWLTVRQAPSTASAASAASASSVSGAGGPTGSRGPTGSSVPASPTTAPASVRVCVTGLPCEEKEWREGDTVYLHPPREVRPSDLDGRAVRVTVREAGRALTGVGTLAYAAGGDGPCSCSYSTAEVEVGR